VLLGLVFIGGIKRIAKVADLLVPVKTLAYIGVTLYVIGTQIEHVPAMLKPSSKAPSVWTRPSAACSAAPSSWA
jgi:AGCS family alanine or glycine:cation symporter